MIITRIYEPIPYGRKSSYGKCAVYESGDGSKALRSYSTIVMTQDADGTLHRHWGGRSNTTSSHIKAAFGIDGKQYGRMEVERLPRKWAYLESMI